MSGSLEHIVSCGYAQADAERESPTSHMYRMREAWIGQSEIPWLMLPVFPGNGSHRAFPSMEGKVPDVAEPI